LPPLLFIYLILFIMAQILAENTTEILKTYLSDVLESYQLNARTCAYKLEFTFGEQIHKAIDGFIQFAKENDFDSHDIKATLCHDLGGGLNHDKLMMPRVSEYGVYSINL
jgi:hypothetical protein